MLLNVDQVAEMLAVSRATIWRYVAANGTFPQPLKLSPGCSRWYAEEVEDWLDTRERTAVAAPLTAHRHASA